MPIALLEKFRASHLPSSSDPQNCFLNGVLVFAYVIYSYYLFGQLISSQLNWFYECVALLLLLWFRSRCTVQIVWAWTERNAAWSCSVQLPILGLVLDIAGFWFDCKPPEYRLTDKIQDLEVVFITATSINDKKRSIASLTLTFTL